MICIVHSDANGTAVNIVVSSQISTGYITLPVSSFVTLKFNEVCGSCSIIQYYVVVKHMH